MVKHKAQTGWLWEAVPGGKPKCLEGGAGQIDDGMGEKEGDNMKEHWELDERGTGSEKSCGAARCHWHFCRKFGPWPGNYASWGNGQRLGDLHAW